MLSVEIDLKQKVAQNEELQKEIQLLKLTKYENANKNTADNKITSYCSNCKLLDIKLNSIR